MLTMKRSGESTHPCRTPTPTVNGRDVTLPTRTHVWAGIQWLDGQQHAGVNTVLTQHSPKRFTRNPVVCFLEVDKACEGVFSILPRQGFLRCFRDPIRVPTLENRVPRIRK